MTLCDIITLYVIFQSFHEFVGAFYHYGDGTFNGEQENNPLFV